MGSCVSTIPHDEPPKCNVCGVSGKEPWGRLSTQQRNYWSQRGSELVCRKCAAGNKTRKDLLNEERTKLKKLKDKLYPKVEHHTTLKKIKSGEGWQNTQSFYESWRPASFLAPLVNMARKATGTPQDLHAPAAEPFTQASYVQHAQHAMAKQLDEIEEDMVIVEEESICTSSEADLEDVCLEAAGILADGGSQPGGHHVQLAAPSSRCLQLMAGNGQASRVGLVKRDDTASGESWSSAAKIDACSQAVGEGGRQMHEQHHILPEQVAVTV